MARIPRILIAGETTAYHVISRTAFDGFPMGDVEKDFMFGLIKRLSFFYFTEIMGFCLLDNHFHLLVKMIPERWFADKEIKQRFERFYGDGLVFSDGQISILTVKPIT